MGGEHIVSVTPVGCLLKVQQVPHCGVWFHAALLMWRSFYVIWLRLTKRKQRDQCRCYCWPEARSLWKHPLSSAEPRSKESISMVRTPERRAENLPAEPNSQLIALRDRERGEKEVEAGGSYWAWPKKMITVMKWKGLNLFCTYLYRQEGHFSVK